MAITLADEFVQKWAESLGFPVDTVRRIVIDAEAGHFITVHVEMYGQEGLIDVQPPANSVVVTSKVTS